MAVKRYLDLAGFQKAIKWIKDTFVVKEDGKGLFSGKYQDLTGVPTKLSEFDNTETDFVSSTTAQGYATTAEQNAKDYVDEAVGAITGFNFSIVEQLPEVGEKGIIYLVAATEGDNVTADRNVYNEYIWITKMVGESEQSQFELIGTTDMDLTGYLQETDISAITDDEIDAACGITTTPSEPDGGSVS